MLKCKLLLKKRLRIFKPNQPHLKINPRERETIRRRKMLQLLKVLLQVPMQLNHSLLIGRREKRLRPKKMETNLRLLKSQNLKENANQRRTKMVKHKPMSKLLISPKVKRSQDKRKKRKTTNRMEMQMQRPNTESRVRKMRVMKKKKREQIQRTRKKTRRKSRRTLCTPTQWISKRRESSSQCGSNTDSETGEKDQERLLLLLRL